MPETQRVDVVVIGAGIAGLVVTVELLEQLDPDKRILLVDRCQPEEVGGLAREAFGGMFMVDTPEQRRSGIKDSFELAREDWLRVPEFEEQDRWPRRWAEEYIGRARDEVGGWLKSHGVRFFPVVNWAERGVYGDGNSVPRFHLTWRCGKALVDQLWAAIQHHPTKSRLEVQFRTCVTELIADGDAVTGCRNVSETDRRTIDAEGQPAPDNDGVSHSEVSAEQVVVAAGGIGGNLDVVRREWPAELGEPPKEILMGSHYGGSPSFATGVATGSEPAGSSGSWTQRRCR